MAVVSCNGMKVSCAGGRYPRALCERLAVKNRPAPAEGMGQSELTTAKPPNQQLPLEHQLGTINGPVRQYVAGMPNQEGIRDDDI